VARKRKERERRALQALIDQFVKPAIPPLEAVAEPVVNVSFSSLTLGNRQTIENSKSQKVCSFATEL
jgi:hypothetical protein